MVTINGKEEPAEGKSVLQYLEDAGFNVERVVVELNYEIIPKDKLASVFFKDGDSVEVLNFVGGG